MPTNAESWAVDTSVAVAAVDSAHTAHSACAAAVRRHRPVLSGHAAWETYSVLTRMPGSIRVDGTTASAVLDATFGRACRLDESAEHALWDRVASIGITGGAVYDALVGEAARVNGRRLLTRDLRARRTYDLLGVDHQYVET